MANEDQPTLLLLPAEIRNQIFAIALKDSTLDIDAQYYRHAADLPGLVATCKQTYAETLHTYYSSLTIVSKDSWILDKWLDAAISQLPSPRFSLVKRICLDNRNRSEERAPLQPSQRFALSYHTDRAVQAARARIASMDSSKKVSFEVKACIISPSQDLIWTTEPMILNENIEQRWEGLSREQRRTSKMEEWMPSGLDGIYWERG